MYESILSYCIDDKLHCVINAEVLPNQESPVYSGKTSWVIKANNKDGSKISYKSDFVADIFLPPVSRRPCSACASYGRLECR